MTLGPSRGAPDRLLPHGGGIMVACGGSLAVYAIVAALLLAVL